MRTEAEFSIKAPAVGNEQSTATMDDDLLGSTLVRLCASHAAQGASVGDGAQIHAQCKRAIRQRLIDGDLRVYLSRLVREAYLSEEALAAGSGVEDVWEFWTWFDQTMWPEPSTWQAERDRDGSVRASEPPKVPVGS